MIKAIQTGYNGYLFRSRLEARWAVFFDTLGIEYQYEPEGFDLDGTWYLPDFWLPFKQSWVEIKPTIPNLREPGVRAYELCRRLADQTEKIALLIGGQPWVQDMGDHHKSEYEIAVFTPKMIGSTGYHTDVLGWGRFIQSPERLNEENFCLSPHLYGFICSQYHSYPELFSEPLPSRGDFKAIIEADKVYHKAKYCGEEHPFWLYGLAEHGYTFSYAADCRQYLSCGAERPNKYIYRALKAARQARFETSR